MTQQEQVQTTAQVAAGRNWEANRAALGRQQPTILEALAHRPSNVEWLLGRDGSLTARDTGGWVSGSSLPRRTAEKLFEKLSLRATVICFLAPTHAAQIRVVLERLEPGQALISIVPDAQDLRLILACDDFSHEIDRGRLWLAAGEVWEAELQRLLRGNDGLPLPGQFVRTALVDHEQIDALIARAQDVFNRESQWRADWITECLNQNRSTEPERMGVWAPAAFRLWQDQGAILQRIAGNERWSGVDTDNPCQASPVAFARMAAECGAILMTNLGRTDLPVHLPPQTRVITWLTRPIIPACTPGDRLLLADPAWRAKALAMGWRDEQVAIATWPKWQPQSPGTGLAVIADTIPLTMPDFVLSSLNVLWESITRQIAEDPFAVGTDVEAYLTRWQRGVGIADEAIDRRTFIEHLIRPAYAQALVRLLTASGLEVKLYGRGWGQIEEFASRSAGDIASRQELERAVETSAALVHVGPEGEAHAIRAMGRAVLGRNKSKDAWLREAAKLARGTAGAPAVAGPELSAELLRQVV
jgi:hypothetical protein